MPRRSRTSISQRSLDEMWQKLYEPAKQQQRTWRDWLLFGSAFATIILVCYSMFLLVRMVLVFAGIDIVGGPSQDTIYEGIAVALAVASLPFITIITYRQLVGTSITSWRSLLRTMFVVLPSIIIVMGISAWLFPGPVLDHIFRLLFGIWGVASIVQDQSQNNRRSKS